MTTGEAPCDRFERQALLRLEQGLPLDSHFDRCPACREARAAYQRLAGDIAGAAADRPPPAHWQARVWAAIARRRARRRRRSWWLWLAPAAAAALVLVVLRIDLPAPEAALEVAVEAGGGVRRGAEAQPGDRLVLRATAGGAPHAELRVYRDDAELVLWCSTAAPCNRRGDALEAAFVLPAVGSYQPLLLVSEAPLPAPAAGGLDADAAAAFDAGARVELGGEIRVR